MVAYSFKERFVDPIKAGLLHAPSKYYLTKPKRQTIRAHRRDGRHAKPGDTLLLYSGMRTTRCFSIGVARCVSVHPIVISVREDFMKVVLDGEVVLPNDDFAQADGFETWREMHAFWKDTHGLGRFGGMLIRWELIT